MKTKGVFATFGRMAVAALLLGAFVSSLSAYVLEGQSWTKNRTVFMQLSLGATPPLIDGSPSYNAVARDALNIWNQYMAHLQFGSVFDSPVPPERDDDEMSVFFSSSVFGKSFGTRTLAVTTLRYRSSVMEETDTVFNNTYNWNSYRGPLRSGMQDLRRVAIHEFGHTLGLDHPDDANQHVSAVMNSIISDLDTVQADDIAGVQALYSSGPAYLDGVNAPVLQNISTRTFIGTGQNVLIGGFIIQGREPATVIVRGIGYSLTEAGIPGALTDPMITVYNASNQVVATNDDWFTSSGAQTIASYRLDPHNSIEAALQLTLAPGAYTAIVKSYSDSSTPATPGVGLFELYDLHTTGGRAGNISSRGQVQGGDNVMIGGFIIGGGVPKEVIVRALGPSLGSAGIVGPLSNPMLDLYDGNGAVIQSNDDWQQDPNAGIIAARGLAPSDARESAVLATLNAGSYTAIVRGVGGTVGVGLVEVYDQSPAP